MDKYNLPSGSCPICNSKYRICVTKNWRYYIWCDCPREYKNIDEALDNFYKKRQITENVINTLKEEYRREIDLRDEELGNQDVRLQGGDKNV